MGTPYCNSRLRSAFWGSACPSPAQTSCHQSKVCVRVTASLSGKGKRFPAELITVRKIMGEGSYGQVFEGALDSEQGPARVVLKRVKKRVQGAEEMGQMEHLLNVYASKAAKGSIADFVGYIEVDDEHATMKLTQGVWLMWRYQGSRTLGYYLRRRDCIAALAEDLGVQSDAVVATVFKQVLEGIAALHSAGLVHRDIKPMNVIFDEDDRKFKLIDLGACADLRSGTNYVPDESILDPTYCPPEQYCMPTDAPHLAKHGAFAMAMSPLLWRRFKPDKFDSYSAGLCLMQLAVPKLRTSSGLLKFNEALKAADYDLAVWRERTNLPAKETALLDADDSAGWDLAEALLRPRKIEVNEDSGTVKFVNTNKQAARLGVSQALDHRFMQQATSTSVAVAPPKAGRTRSMNKSSGRSTSADGAGPAVEQTAAALTASASPNKGGVFGMAMGVWRKATSKLFDLEAKIAKQSDAVRTQTARVEQLKGKAATGKVSLAKVQQEESVLTKMTGRLTSLTSEFNSTAQSANRLLGSLMGRGNRPAIDPASIPMADSVAQASTSYSRSPSQASSRRSDLPPSLQRSRPAWQQAVPTADPVMDSAQFPAEDAANSPRAVSDGPAPDRQKADKPKVVRRKLTSVNSNRITSSGSSNSSNRSTSNSSSSSSSNNNSSSLPATSSSKVSSAGVNMLYAGLKFTGLALGVASDLAKAVRQDAEKMMKEIEADAAARKLAKEQAAAFVDLLREAQPALTSASSLADAEAASRRDERWLVMTPDRRQQIFGTYIDALIKLEDAAKPKAAADFRMMLAQGNIRLEDDWAGVQSQLATLPAYSAVQSEADRQELFQQYIAELQEAADQAAAAAKQEKDFWLLLESQDPPLTPQSSWVALRRKIQSHPSYTALPERRSRQLFNQYHSTLKDLQPVLPSSSHAPTKEQASAAQSPAQPSGMHSVPGMLRRSHAQSQDTDLTPARPAVSQLEQEVVAVEEAMADVAMQSAVAQQPTASEANPSDDALEVLRQEQAQMKREYDRMQAKLLEMEALLLKNDPESGPGNSAASAPQPPARGLTSANGSSAGGSPFV